MAYKPIDIPRVGLSEGMGGEGRGKLDNGCKFLQFL